MSKQLRFKGGFRSVNDTLYDMEIWQEDYKGASTHVAFCDTPIEIEWADTDKLEPVQSSRATVTLFSDTDRQFVDLYTIKAGSIRIDIYRNKTRYWSGTLDPELYEEPFSYQSGYGVTLTFSDLAILERLKWNRSGFMSLKELFDYCLSQSGIKHLGIEEYVSTQQKAYSNDNLLTEVSVQTENFYDEEGEPMSIREVLDETLRPFALHLVQKAGKVIIYDLNALHAEPGAKEIEWQGADAVLGVDKVYNNVKVTFSPYERTELLDGEVDRESVPGTGTLVRTDNTTNQWGTMSSPEGFRIALSDTGKGLKKSPKARFFRIDPVYSGDESAGVAWCATTRYNSGNSYPERPTPDTGEMLFKVPYMAYMADTGYSNRGLFKLKINLNLLFDPRYNPFESASLPNEEGNWAEQNNWANYAYVPFLLTLRDASGTALYHWENKQVKDSGSYDHANKCKWIAGEGNWGDAWLCWYDGNRKNESGLGGWKGNKQIIGYYRGDLPVLFTKMESGEYVDLPPTSGWLELQIGTGVPAYDYKNKNDWEIVQRLYDQCRWVLYKNPKVTLVDKNSKTLQTKDIEHNAWINPDAKEDIAIDTILGTLKKSSPTALGQLFRTTDKTVIESFYRAGETDLLERLLIGTVYSNYASRHNTLSGTASLQPDFGTYLDKNESGSYLLLSETQHLREDESEIKAVQFEADSYKGIIYKDETV